MVRPKENRKAKQTLYRASLNGSTKKMKNGVLCAHCKLLEGEQDSFLQSYK